MARKEHKAKYNRGRMKRRPVAAIRRRKAARRVVERQRLGGPVIIRTFVPMTRLEKKSIRRLVRAYGGSWSTADRVVQETAAKRAQGIPCK